MFLHGFRSFAAVCVTVACLIIMGSVCLISYNLRVMAADLENDNKILVYIDETYTEAEAQGIHSMLSMIPNVEKAEFVTRQEALENFVEEQGDSALFEGVTADTLRDRCEVTLVDYSLMEQTVREIEGLTGVAEVGADYDIADGFRTVQNVLDVASLAIILVLFVVSLFIVSNTVKLAMYDRKEEIAIMRMVGATNGFIRFPFLVEGFFLGTFGAIIGFFLEWGLYDLLQSRINAMDDLKLFTIVPFTDVFFVLLIAYLITGFLVGVVGSMLSIRKFLKV